MTHKVYIVTDLGPGDGGKGGVVHKISTMMRAHTIIKVGGAQGSHGVTNSRGEHFAFSQWGCGTLEGVRTHISSRLVISPTGLLNEARALRYGCGIHDPFALLTIDQEALCATPYHGISSRLKEMARGHNPRGTIGTGVGEAYRFAQKFPELAIHVRDLSRADLRDLLVASREQISRELAPIIQAGFLPEDSARANSEIELLTNDNFLEYAINSCQEVSRVAKIVDHDFLGREVLSRDGVAIVESSHGILTDHYQGFHPHTSAIRTLPCFTQALLKSAGYNGIIVNLGVTRAYQIRHGAGPMPTADPTMSDLLLPGSHKEENRYQGKIRVGPLDLVLLRYALAAGGGPTMFDGIAVTWFDQIQANLAWRICDSYHGADNPTYFTPAGELKIRRGDDEQQLLYQAGLGQQLLNCLPEISTHKISPDATSDQLCGTPTVPDTTPIDQVTARLKELGVDAMGGLAMIESIKVDLGVETLEDLSSLNEDDLVGIGMKKIQARKLVAALRPIEAPVAETATAVSAVAFDDVLPMVPSDASWLEALRTGGVLKIEQSTVVAAIRAALAHRAGLFGIPEGLTTLMEQFADQNEDQVDPEFFKLRKMLTRRSYAEIFEAIDGLDGTYVTEGRKKQMFQRVDQYLWPAIINFYNALKSWQEAWMQGAANPAMMMSVLMSASHNGPTLPPGMMQPPDTGVLRDHADAVADAVNKVFAGTGVQIAAAVAYDANRIKEILANPRLPALTGAANRDQMLKQLGVAVSATYPRLEMSLTRFVLAIMQVKDQPAGAEELQYFGSLFMFGSQIPWDQLNSGGGKVTSIGGRRDRV